MVCGVGFAQEFWEKVVGTACYIKNKSPITLVQKTSYEIWSHKKPSFVHLIVFGFDAFVHIPKEKRRNLDNNVNKCIFIGYNNGVKGYKLWNPIIRKIVYSQDVIFKEVESTSWNEDESKGKELEKMEFELKNEGSNSFLRMGFSRGLGD